MDARIEGQYPRSAALKAAALTVKCLSAEAKFRPTMDEVVKALEQLQDSNDMALQKWTPENIDPRHNRKRLNDENLNGKAPMQ